MAGSRGERPPQLSVVDALELTVLVARKDSRGTSGSLRGGSRATSKSTLP
jgi:hypothetical protein